jgi:hypothetical protein
MFSSILISDGGKRNELFYRCLKSIERNPPKGKFEVVVATDNLQKWPETQYLLSNFNFSSKLVVVDNQEFEQKTGLTHYFNSPTLTNNAAFVNVNKYSQNIFLMGNEILAYKNVFNEMTAKRTTYQQFVVSTTYDIPESILKRLNRDGSNVDELIGFCTDYPLASQSYHSDVTNYISMCHVSLWNKIGGYDERYVAGIAAEDSDFIQRCRAVPNFEMVRCGREAISLHQFHGGKTMYYEPKQEVIDRDKWDRGVEINRKLYREWNGQYQNSMPWKQAEYGIVKVINVNASS